VSVQEGEEGASTCFVLGPATSDSASSSTPGGNAGQYNHNYLDVSMASWIAKASSQMKANAQDHHHGSNCFFERCRPLAARGP